MLEQYAKMEKKGKKMFHPILGWDLNLPFGPICPGNPGVPGSPFLPGIPSRPGGPLSPTKGKQMLTDIKINRSSNITKKYLSTDF